MTYLTSRRLRKSSMKAKIRLLFVFLLGFLLAAYFSFHLTCGRLKWFSHEKISCGDFETLMPFEVMVLIYIIIYGLPMSLGYLLGILDKRIDISDASIMFYLIPLVGGAGAWTMASIITLMLFPLDTIMRMILGALSFTIIVFSFSRFTIGILMRKRYGDSSRTNLLMDFSILSVVFIIARAFFILIPDLWITYIMFVIFSYYILWRYSIIFTSSNRFKWWLRSPSR